MIIEGGTNEVSFAILVQKKAKAQPARQTPVQEMFMMRKYTPGELIDITAKFQQKVAESIQAWLIWQWCMGSVGFL